MSRTFTWTLIVLALLAGGVDVSIARMGRGGGAGSGGTPAAPASAYLAQGGAVGTSTTTQAITFASSTGATGYNVYRGLNGATPTLLASNQTCCTYTDLTAANSNATTNWTYLNRYTYYVTATNGSGESAGTYPNAWSYSGGKVNGALGNYYSGNNPCWNEYSFPDPLTRFNVSTIAGSNVVKISPASTTAVFAGYIKGSTLTVTTLTSGTISVNNYVYGPGVALNGSGVQQITALGTASGGTGNYTVSVSQTLGSSGSPVSLSSGSTSIYILPGGMLGNTNAGKLSATAFASSTTGATILAYGSGGTTGTGAAGGTYQLSSTANSTITNTGMASWITNCQDTQHPENGATYDMALAAEGGLQLYTTPYLAPTYNLNLGAFNYFLTDVYLPDANESGTYLAYTRPGANNNGAGDINPNVTATLFRGTTTSYCVNGGAGTMTVGAWNHCKVPFTALALGSGTVTGTNAVNYIGPCNETSGGALSRCTATSGATANISAGDIIAAQGYDFAWTVSSCSPACGAKATSWVLSGGCGQSGFATITGGVFYDVPMTTTRSTGVGPVQAASISGGTNALPDGTVMCGSGTAWHLFNGQGSTIPANASSTTFNVERIDLYKTQLKVTSSGYPSPGYILVDNIGWSTN